MKCTIALIGAESANAGGTEGLAATRLLPFTFSLNSTAEGMEMQLWLRPWGMLRFAAALLVVGYIAAGLALGWYFDRTPHNRLHAADFLLPWRWSGVADLRGQTFCAQGIEALAGNHIGTGIFLVRRGLALHSNDSGARLALGRLYARYRDYEDVRATLLPQVGFPPVPRPLLELLFTEANHAGDLATIDECAEQLIAHAGSAPADLTWLQLRRAEALLVEQKPELALRALAALEMRATPEAAALRIEALCLVGRVDEAIALAMQLPRDSSQNERQRWRWLARGYRSAGRKTELSAALAAMIAQDPVRRESRVDAIREFWAAQMGEEARRELHALLRRVSTRPGAIAAIVDALAADRAPELIRICIDEARALGQPTAALLPALSMACLSVGDWAGAEQTFGPIFGPERKLAEADAGARESLRALIDAGSDGSFKANDHLRLVLEKSAYPLRSYLQLAAGFAHAGRWPGLQIIAQAGLRRFPRSTELQRCQAQASERLESLGASPAVLPSEPEQRRAAIATLFAGLNAKTFSARVAAHVQREEWAAADELIANARRLEPPWLGTIARELDWQEARVAMERNDRRRLVQAIGEGLRRNARDIERALALAREAQTRGDDVTARAIAEKIIEVVPESGKARQFQDSLEDFAGAAK